MMVINKEAGTVQRSEMRLAFWAGATTLFYAIMRMLDPGKERTEADLAKMDALHKEVEAFARTFDAEVVKRWSTP